MMIQSPPKGPRRFEPRRGLLVLALAAVLSGPASAALWYENYNDAKSALSAEKWNEAVDLLQQAVDQKSDSGANVRTYGVNFIEYFPYLKLGIAHYHLGNFDAALAWLQREEALGEVLKSPGDYGELKRIRELARKEKESVVAGERQRIVDETLERARTLEARGELQAAMDELAKALAVDPENEEVGTARVRIQGALADRREREELNRRFAGLVDQGKRLLAGKRYGEAAAAFQQAGSLKPDPEAQALLRQAQTALAAELAAEQDAARTEATISDGLAHARELQGAGELDQALQELQTVLALDPGNRTAMGIQEQLLRAQKQAAQREVRDETVAALGREIESAYGDGAYERVIALASRGLLLDPENQRLRDYFQRVSRLLQRRLIQPVGQMDLPPTIAFDNPRDDETNEEAVNYGRYDLRGRVISTSPHRLDILRGESAITDIQQEPLELADGQFLTRFEVEENLPVGLSVYRVVATDEEGRAESAEHRVRFVLPFYRRSWFYAVLLGSVIVAAGGAYVRREYQRRQLYKRRFNPYIAGAPVLKEDLFFGRDRLLSRVLQTIHNNSILLYGERRIGKTSFQHHLKNRLKKLQDPDYRFYPVFIDLQGTPEDKFFSTLAEDLFEELAPHLDGLEPSPTLRDGSGYGYREFVRDLRKVLKVLKDKNEKKVKVALLIDEVDELNDYDPRINQKLRSLFMRNFSEDLVSVVSGVGIKKHWESEGSPWYNFFEEIEVAPFRQEDAEELIEGPIRGIFLLERGVADRIIEVSNCRPYLIQKLCVALVNRLHDEKRRKITVADVESLAGAAEV